MSPLPPYAYHRRMPFPLEGRNRLNLEPGFSQKSGDAGRFEAANGEFSLALWRQTCTRRPHNEEGRKPTRRMGDSTPHA